LRDVFELGSLFGNLALALEFDFGFGRALMSLSSDIVFVKYFCPQIGYILPSRSNTIL
jgi:hypothetical protein